MNQFIFLRSKIPEINETYRSPKLGSEKMIAEAFDFETLEDENNINDESFEKERE